jgi:hypothetical protein
MKSSLLVITALACSTLAPAVFAQGNIYERRYTKAQVERVINRVERQSNGFRKQFDYELDRGHLDGTEREDKLNDKVRDFERSLNELRGEFDRSDSWWATRNNVRKVRDQADRVNFTMTRRNFSRGLERLWITMRREINGLCRVYNLPFVR